MSLYPISTSQRTAANAVFQSTLHHASLTRLIERILRRYQPLADFNELNELKANIRTNKGLQTVPLNQIKGSVNRQGDFDSKFRPLRNHLRDRWVNVFMLMQTDGWEPVKLNKVGDSYYVEDGHHRVSAASVSGRHFIEAEVWEYDAGTQPCCCKPVRIPARLTVAPSCCEQCAVRI